MTRPLLLTLAIFATAGTILAAITGRAPTWPFALAAFPSLLTLTIMDARARYNRSTRDLGV